MASEKYRQYLESNAWQIKRILVLSQVDCCEGCLCDDEPLQVHHLTYERIYQEELSDLMALCDRCHREAEDGIKKGELSRTGQGLREETTHYIRRTIGHAYKPKPYPNEAIAIIRVPRIKPIKR